MNDDGSYTSGSIHSPFAKVENVSSEYTNINSVCRSYQLGLDESDCDSWSWWPRQLTDRVNPRYLTGARSASWAYSSMTSKMIRGPAGWTTDRQCVGRLSIIVRLRTGQHRRQRQPGRSVVELADHVAQASTRPEDKQWSDAAPAAICHAFRARGQLLKQLQVTSLSRLDTMQTRKAWTLEVSYVIRSVELTIITNT